MAPANSARAGTAGSLVGTGASCGWAGPLMVGVLIIGMLVVVVLVVGVLVVAVLMVGVLVGGGTQSLGARLTAAAG